MNDHIRTRNRQLRVRKAQVRRAFCEPLEQRTMLSTNLAVESAQLVNWHGTEVPFATIGEQVFARLRFTISDLPFGATYRIRYSLDSVPLISDPLDYKAGEPGVWSASWRLGKWFASPGTHSMVITLDPDNSIAESNESDNTFVFSFTPQAPTDLPSKFVLPIGGQRGVDWQIGNYVDVDILPSIPEVVDHFSDFRGGPYTYDRHDALDIGIANFAAMDRGVPVYAAAAGVVSEVEDGDFDRWTAWQTPAPPANHVIIDHGNGWKTLYWHLRSSSIMVSPTQAVAAGQLLGYVGSSGYSTGPHLHFGVEHNGAVVETSYAAEAYWTTPLSYTGDVAPSLLDFEVANYDLQDADWNERPTVLSQYNTAAGQLITAWGVYSGVKAGDVYEWRWFAPGNVQWGDADRWTEDTTSGTIRRPDRRFLPNSPQVGTWRVEWWVNGTKLGQRNFEVGAQGTSETHLKNFDAYIVNGRTSPIPFGSIAVADAAQVLPFNLENKGPATLLASIASLPPGIEVVGTFPTSIPAYSSSTFSLRMNSSVPRDIRGNVVIATNDPNAERYSFAVAGSVNGPELDARPLGGGVLLDQISSIDFGSVVAGQHDSIRQIVLRNTGNTILNLHDWAIASSAFVFDGTPPASLEPGQTVSVQIHMAAGVPGDKAAQLSFRTNDPQQPILQVELHGLVTSSTQTKEAEFHLLALLYRNVSIANVVGTMDQATIDAVVQGVQVELPTLVNQITGGQVQARVHVQVIDDTLTSMQFENGHYERARDEDIARELDLYSKPGWYDDIIVFHNFHDAQIGPTALWGGVPARDGMRIATLGLNRPNGQLAYDDVPGMIHEWLHGLDGQYFENEQRHVPRPQYPDGGFLWLHSTSKYGYNSPLESRPAWSAWYGDYFTDGIRDINQGGINTGYGLGPDAWAHGVPRNDLPYVAGSPLELPDKDSLTTQYVSDLYWASSTWQWLPARRDRTVDDHVIEIAGTRYAKGIGVHANSEVLVNLRGKADRFQSLIGVDDDVPATNGSVVFKVFGDGNLLFRSDVLTGALGAVPVDVSVRGVQQLRLVVEDAGDGNNSDHGAWGNARLTPFAGVYASDLAWRSSTVVGSTIYLSDSNWTSSHTDFDTIRRDSNITNEKPITIRGIEYGKGVTAHANSQIVVPLAGQATRFQAVVGIDDDAPAPNGSVVFKVFGDGTLLYQSGVRTGAMAGLPVDINLAGVQELRLVVEDGGDGAAFDHAAWADARFTFPGGSFPKDVGWTSSYLTLDKSPTLTTIGINGVSYGKGIGMPSNGEVVIALGGQFSTFSSLIGIDDSVGNAGSVRFKVIADGQTKYTSARITGADAAIPIAVDVTGINELTLQVLDDGDGTALDNAVWALPYFVRATTAAPDVSVLGKDVSILTPDLSPSVLDGTDFGTAIVGSAGPTQRFEIRNDGTKTLVFGSRSFPAGYLVENDLVASLAPGAADEVILRLDTSQIGLKSGDVVFFSDDPDEAQFSFRLSGKVVGANDIPNAIIRSEPLVVAAGGTGYIIRVTYTDDNQINAATIGTGDVAVTGPNGFNQPAQFVGLDSPGNAPTKTAYYRLTPPGGSWDAADNGPAYTVRVVAGAVTDNAGNPVADSSSVFSVNIPTGLISIPITNPSFEQPVKADGQFEWMNVVGWNTGGSQIDGVQNWTSQQYIGATGDSGPSVVPEGRNSAVSRGGVFSQTLASDTLLPLSRYTLNVDVGYRLDGGYAPYKIQLFAGGQWLADALPLPAEPEPGEFRTATLTFETGSTHPQLGQPLEIRMFAYDVPNSSSQVNFDQVRLWQKSLDTANPTATINTPSPGVGAPTYEFTVEYTDDNGIDSTTFGNDDILVTGGPSNFNVFARYISSDVLGDAKHRWVTYRIDAPGGYWNPPDNGTYQFAVQSGSVRDLAGNPVVPISASLVVNLPAVNSTTPSVANLMQVSNTGNPTDSITYQNNSLGRPLQFFVSDTWPSATVRIYADGLLIGSALADATFGSATVTTNETLILADGVHYFTATQQREGELESAPTTALAVTIDSTPPIQPHLSTSTSAKPVSFGVVFNDPQTQLVLQQTGTPDPSFAGYYLDAETTPTTYDPSRFAMVDLNGHTSDFDPLQAVLSAFGTNSSFYLTLYSRTVDVAGNVSPETVATFAGDQVAPSALPMQTADVRTAGLANVSYTVTYSDARAIDANAFFDGMSPDRQLTGFTGIDLTKVDVGNVKLIDPQANERSASRVAGIVPTADGLGVIVTYEFDAPAGTWNSGDNGNYRIDIVPNQVTDIVGNVLILPSSINFEIDVSNAPPVLAPIGSLTIDELTNFSKQLSATSLLSLPLTYSMILGTGFHPTNLPTMTNSGLFRWIPLEFDNALQSTFLVTFRVTDTDGLFDEEQVEITVNEVNQPPLFSSIPAQQAAAGAPFSLPLTVSDLDLPVQTLTWSLSGGPAGNTATINPVTGAFNWTPTIGDIGQQNFTVTVTDDGLPTLGVQQQLVINVQPAVSATELGTITTLQIPDVQVPAAGLLYHFTSSRAGLLTLEAAFDSALGSPLLRLLNQQGNELALASSGDGTRRLDVAVAGGTGYFLSVEGAHPSVDLRLTNALTQSGSSVTLVGGDGDDQLTFTAADPFDLSLNGAHFFFPRATLASIAIDGGIGNDSLVLQGSNDNETVELHPVSATWTATGYTLTGIGVEHIDARGGGGSDQAKFFDSAGNDRFDVQPSSATMSGPGFMNAVAEFRIIRAMATTGQDVAYLNDSPGDDQFIASSEQSQLAGATGLVSVTHFDIVRALASTGNDTARLDGSDGDDQLVMRPDNSQISGAGYLVAARGFDSITANAKLGNDQALFYDSTGDDQFVQQPRQAKLSTTNWFGIANDFDHVRVYASTGLDRATLYDSDGVDVFVTRPGFAQLTGPGYDASLNGFDEVRAYATSTTDIANINGSQNSESVLAQVDSIQLVGPGVFVRAQGFSSARAYGGGGNDTASIYGGTNDLLDAGPTYARLTSGSHASAFYDFSSVRVTAGQGQSRASLVDSALDDDLFAASGSLTLTNPQMALAIYNFREVIARGTSGTNRRHMNAIDFALQFEGNWLDD